VIAQIRIKNMNFNKIIANITAGLLVPIFLNIRWFPNVYDAVFNGVYRYYDFQIKSLDEFLYHVYGSSYLFEYAFSVIMVLLPFQLIKDYFLKKKGKLSFFGKWGILSAIIVSWILIWGSVSNIWTSPWYHNFIYLAFPLGFGLVFTTLLYFMVDRYVEKNKQLTKNE
jgi:hypothetical protein